jgi:hypothetical protein
MTESTLRAALVKKLREYKDWIVLRHEDHYTSGIPDISVTGNKKTSWWETKYQKNLSLINKGIQQYTLEQLSRFGYAYYIIYTPEQVAVAEPSKEPKIFVGINHTEVVNYIRSIHGF